MPDESMPITARLLAEAIARRLDPIAPHPFGVRANGENLTVDHPDGWGFTMLVAEILEQDDDPDVEWMRSERHRASAIVGNALSALQDAVAESTREPWPAPPGSRTMLGYDTRHDDAAIHLWYGPESAPVIAFAPIPFAEIDAARAPAP